MLDRNHLLILQQVERQGSLTAASQTLCLTQSALSHAIKKLERQLGGQVWVKEGRRLRLTVLGEYLLNFANRMLPQFEYTEQVVKDMVNGERGVLRIGMECYPCYQWLMREIASFLHEHPKADMDVKQKFQFGGIAALLSYDIDLLVTPDPLQHPQIEFTSVFDYEQVLVVSSNHPFVHLPFVTPEQLAGTTLYTYPVAEDRLDIYTQFLLPANVRPKLHKTIEATEMMVQLVAANRGVATLPRWLVEEFSNQAALTSVSLGKDGIRKSIHLGVRQEDANNSLAKTFVLSC